MQGPCLFPLVLTVLPFLSLRGQEARPLPDLGQVLARARANQARMMELKDNLICILETSHSDLDPEGNPTSTRTSRQEQVRVQGHSFLRTLARIPQTERTTHQGRDVTRSFHREERIIYRDYRPFEIGAINGEPMPRK